MRSPVVADRFYPGNPLELRKTLNKLVPEIPEEEKLEALAVISPHAGYVYSGGVAGETMAGVRIPGTVIILGPNHHGQGAPLALGMQDWRMPLGEVLVDQDLALGIIRRSKVITGDETAHQFEHSLEVQVPFLQYFREDVRIVPIVVSHVPFEVCLEAARDLAGAVHECGRQVLLVASTDMTHYEPRRIAGRQDRLALDRIEALDARGLYDTVVENRISMCGFVPTTIVLLTALELGASRAELVRYTDSGEMSGDSSQVVGYAGMIIS